MPLAIELCECFDRENFYADSPTSLGVFCAKNGCCSCPVALLVVALVFSSGSPTLQYVCPWRFRCVNASIGKTFMLIPPNLWASFALRMGVVADRELSLSLRWSWLWRLGFCSGAALWRFRCVNATFEETFILIPPHLWASFAPRMGVVADREL